MIDNPHSAAVADELTAIEKRLAELIPDPIILTRNQIDALTDDQALEVFRAVRRAALFQLLSQENHEHMGDDCGDYLEAAISNLTHLWDEYFTNDGTGFTETVKCFLRDSFSYDSTEFPLGGCDGEVRFDIFPNLTDEMEEA